MTAPHGHPRAGHPDDNFGEFAEELRLLAEAVLERVEPVLRRTATDGRTQWSSCAWCPVCAAAAVVRGEHHDVVAAIADHGTALVTVLREALAGVPVEPVIPPDLDPESPEYQAWLRDSFGHGDSAGNSGRADGEPGDGSGSESATPTGESGTVGESAHDHAAPGGRSAGAPNGPSAALAGLIARFAAGAQGIRTERDARAEGDTTGARSGGESEARAAAEGDEGVSAPMPGDAFVADTGATAGRRAGGDSSGAAARTGMAAGRRERETSGGGTSSSGSAGTAGRPGTASERGDEGRGRGATRAGYVPIDVTIKA
ncbi:hypothetical protein [Nocardia sp. SYP-A9097]|uniref:hypothetical protein n=1 Tax=Nocardia sp. SYP-A9097 TaxID=2663237 RepID=UPI001891F04F|nr:hypothetical protein [Nocardia sp. SYP-A9097]